MKHVSMCGRRGCRAGSTHFNVNQQCNFNVSSFPNCLNDQHSRKISVWRGTSLCSGLGVDHQPSCHRFYYARSESREGQVWLQVRHAAQPEVRSEGGPEEGDLRVFDLRLDGDRVNFFHRILPKTIHKTISGLFLSVDCRINYDSTEI